MIERGVILARGGPLKLDLRMWSSARESPPRRRDAQVVEHRDGFVSAREFRQRERENLMAALDQARWKIYGLTGAAALLGMKPTTLASRMKALKIGRPDKRDR